MSSTTQSNARSTLLALVEEHMTGLVREAMTVGRHAKRSRLAEDERTVRRRLHAADINMALQMIGSEKLYAVGVAPPSDDKQKKVRLADFLRREAAILPPPPTEIACKQHWLAVDGVQPQIPQNPSGLMTAPASMEARSAAEAGLQVNQLQSSLLSEELQLYFARVTSAMERGGSTAENRRQQDAVIDSLKGDCGLQELVPFLVRYAQQELYRHVNEAEHSRTLVRLVAALLTNPHLHLELHLHEILPPLMTCVVARRLAEGQNHWALRREAAAALVTACQSFGSDYATLKARVLRTLCDAIGPEKPLASRYGGTVAISLFGAKAVDAFLLPTMLESWKHWQEELAATTDLKLLFDIQMCQRALLDALLIFLQRVDAEEKAARLSIEEVSEAFGDQWVVFGGMANAYAECFV